MSGFTGLTQHTEILKFTLYIYLMKCLILIFMPTILFVIKKNGKMFLLLDLRTQLILRKCYSGGLADVMNAHWYVIVSVAGSGQH